MVQRRVLSLRAMAMTLPRTLTPSKMASFTNCPLAFQFTVIERRPEPPSPQAVKGTLVHAALEGLFWRYAGTERTKDAAQVELARAWAELASDPEFIALGLSDDAADTLIDDARVLVDNYFALEDPREVRAIGVELGVEVEQDGMRLRGIIDRLDLDDNGELSVVDYKTGRAPSPRYEQSRLGGVQTYALLCEKLLGRTPVSVRLLYLRDPVEISAVATHQTLRGQEHKTIALWHAIERACATGDFRPKTGPLCRFCHFQSECPAFGAS